MVRRHRKYDGLLKSFVAFFRKTMDFSDINIVPDLTSML